MADGKKFAVLREEWCLNRECWLNDGLEAGRYDTEQDAWKEAERLNDANNGAAENEALMWSAVELKATPANS